MAAEYACTICGKSESNVIDLYTRKSKRLRKDDHRREQSTDAQREQGHRWAHRNGYAVRKAWKDIQSAFKDVKRTDFDRALAALAKGEAPALWAYCIDRFSRKGAEDLLKVIGKVRVIFDLDGLDSNERRDRRWIINRAEEAREYSEILSERVRDTKEQQRDQGLWVAGRAPWGYVVSRDRILSPDEEPYVCHIATRREWSRAALLREMFRMVAEDGASTRDICRWLDGMGVPSPGGKKWRFTYVYRVMHNPAYAGWQVILIRPGQPEPYRNAKGQRVRLKGTALITSERQRKAQDALSTGNVIPAAQRGKDTRRRHLLTDLLRCAGCGRSMPMGGKAYKCQAALGGRACLAIASAKMQSIEDYVFAAWLARLTNADVDDPLLIAVSERWTARVKPEETEEEQAARAALRAAEAGLQRLLADRQAGVYDGAAARYFGPLLREANEAIDAAREEAARYSGGGTIQLPFLSLDQETLTAKWDSAPLAMKRDLLRLAIDRITVRKAPRQGIRFNGRDRLMIEWAAPSQEDFAEAA
ncbi:recombinase family protein [Streptomyces kanamyceticus]|uniref:Recombinase family protein n=1 Tax=Streptomyces kanamyceticus TaxID=1967 RepID=A0A5J6GFS5_STRKN|nr:recombinase family protein [Streptomyces kanamyceticus]QEU92791.1 recombinase family protein [Streptomyces kanamyceticus]